MPVWLIKFYRWIDYWAPNWWNRYTLSEKCSMPKRNNAGNSPLFLSIFMPRNTYQRLLVTPQNVRQYTERIEKFYGFIYKSKPFKTRRHSQVINGRNVSSTYSLRRLCTFVLFKCFACPSTQPNSFLRNWWLRLCVMIGLPFSLIRLNPSCVFRRLPTIPRLPPCLGYDVNRDRNRNITQLCNLL